MADMDTVDMADMDTVDMAEPRHHNHQHSRSRPRQQKPVKTGTWLPAEDVRLREAVAKYGTRWVRAASEVGTRNGDQCAKRWNEKLNPELDHTPWTPEKDERLLSMVKTHGRNWKFIADSFLETRAPLALKNRYSLLMRRLNREATGPQQAGGTSLPRHAASSDPSSGSTTLSSPDSAIGLTNFFGGGKDPHGQLQDYTTMNAASSNFALPTGPFDAGMIPPGDAAAASSRRGRGEAGTTSWPTTATTASTSWDDQDLIWQPPAFLAAGLEPDSVDNDAEQMTMMSDNGTGSQPLLHSGGASSVALSDTGSSGIASAAEVEYSVTCQRGKVRKLMSHLVDAAMSESKEWTAEDDTVTVSLRLKV